jgi:hypothetical protein
MIEGGQLYKLRLPLPEFKPHAFWKNLSALKSSCLTPLPFPYISPRKEAKTLERAIPKL